MRLIFPCFVLVSVFFGFSLAELVFRGDAMLEIAPEALVGRAVNCKAVTGVLSALKALGRPATSFCSSYLHVPATTTITTTTTEPVSTVSVTTTSTTTVATVTTGSVVVIPGANKRSPTGMAHPHMAPRAAVPGPLSTYVAAELSSACSCLSIQPGKTATSTVTAGGGVTTTTITTTATTTATSFTCYATGGPCTAADNCCGQICTITYNALPAYHC